MNEKAIALLLVVSAMAGCTATTEQFTCTTSVESEYNDGVLTVDVTADVTNRAPGKTFEYILVNTELWGDGERVRTKSKKLYKQGQGEFTTTFVLNGGDYRDIRAECLVASVST